MQEIPPYSADTGRMIEHLLQFRSGVSAGGGSSAEPARPRAQPSSSTSFDAMPV
ncbi:hypothetical protein QFZ29_003549 [Agromyces albus]|nr:hypothetical protein [Agromyces albus]